MLRNVAEEKGEIVLLSMVLLEEVMEVSEVQTNRLRADLAPELVEYVVIWKAPVQQVDQHLHHAVLQFGYHHIVLWQFDVQVLLLKVLFLLPVRLEHVISGARH